MINVALKHKIIDEVRYLKPQPVAQQLTIDLI
jgi:hypothetical protein